jgi:anti-sigma factor RsiW
VTDPLDIACREIVEMVTDYLDGALDAATTAAFERHLTDCPHCTLYLEQIRATVAATGRVEVETLSVATRAAILAAFRGLAGRADQRGT